MILQWLWLGCLGLATLTQPVATEKSNKPKITSTNIGHQPASLFYFEDSETALLNTVEGDLYQTVDGGENWEAVKGDDGRMEGNLFIRQHPFDKNKAYALSRGKRHWVTTDRARTWTSFEAEGSAAVGHYPLVFHGRDSSKVIFQTEECAGLFCIVKSYYTTDDFASVKPLRESIGGCAWAMGHPQFAEHLDITEEIEDRSLCVVPGLKVPFSHANRLIYSDDYFGSDIEGTEVKLQGGRPVSGVISTAAVKKFIVAAVKSKGTEELALYTTVDSKVWHRAEFDGHRIKEDAYTMLESTNYSLQVDVLTDPKHGVGVLFTSNSQGTYFTRNIEHTNRDPGGTVDFEKIANIQGVVLVNIVKNPTEVGQPKDKKIASKISFDDGKTFGPLKVGDEELHLHSVTAYANIGRVFSSPAPGLVMGVGNTGSHLGDYAEGNLYISDDAGVTWRLALEGPYKYEFGDQGAVVMAVGDGEKRAKTIRFSIDHGKEWQSVELEDEIYPEMVTTTPDSTSLKFILIGTANKDIMDTKRHRIVSIDFSGLHERKCDATDFEEWAARLDENGEPDCLMGQKQFFRRRKANADCFVDEKFKDPQPIFKPCKCTADDFECEYKPSKGGQGCLLPGSPKIPEGKCQKPSDTYLGPSGWRLIPGNACARDGGANLDKEIERPCNETHNAPAGGILTTKKHFDTGSFAYYYMERQSSSSGDDETILMLTRGDELYVSHDHGKNWELALEGEKITRVILHPYNSDAAFFLSEKANGFWTIDRGHSFKPFKTEAPPTQGRAISPLSFHPRYKDWLIWTGAVDCSSGDCHSDAWFSENRGDTWKLLLRYVQKCEFEYREGRPESENLIFCEQYENENKKNRLQLLSTTNYFSDRTVHIEDVINYATMSEFIVVASRDSEHPKESLVASASVDGRTFAEAQFPPNIQVPVQTAYTVLESSTHAIFLHVTVSNVEGAEYGHLIKSNSNGTFYVLSLSDVNRNDEGFVDFEKMQGLEGVAVVNVVSNVDALSKNTEKKKLRTMITHNDGAEWMLLPPPAKDADGKNFGCTVSAGKGTADCSLHLHGYTERSDERDTFSSGSAIGLMLGVGNVGDHLTGGDDVDTFMTSDGGISWRPVKKGRYMWEYGDSGSVIVIVPEFRRTKSLFYSLDEGGSWDEFVFSDAEVQIVDISTVPSDTSKNFLLWGKESQDKSSTLFTVNIDFSALRSRTCQLDENQGESADYSIWEPRHPFQEKNCLFGHVEQYHRKNQSAQCWNDWREPHVHRIVSNCTCTRSDYECDYNYEPQSDGSCALVPGLTKPDAMAACRNDPTLIEYWEPTGYRRIPQTTCEGGKNLDHVVSKPCPSKEEEYEKKHGIGGVGLFFAIVTPIAVAGAIGYYAYTRWDGKFGQIRLGENAGTAQNLLSRDSFLVSVPIAIVAGVVAVARALPLLARSLWRSVSGRMGLGRSRGYSRPYASRGSFAARRGDYTTVVDDEDELLGVEDADEDDESVH